MTGVITVVLALVGTAMHNRDVVRPVMISCADDLPFELTAAVAQDRGRLTDAIKKASRCGERGRPTVADFDAVINMAWGRKAVHLYILPLDFEEALCRHDAANPNARLGGSLDFHAADKNLVLCVGGVHSMIEKALCEHLTVLVGQKVTTASLGQILVDHLKGLSAKDRADFISKLVMAQECLRTAVKESSLGLVSDEPDCEKVLKRVHQMGAEPRDIVERIAKANQEFKDAFKKCLKQAVIPKTAETFEVNGHKALLYAAPKPAKGKPWVWYSPTLKGVSLVQRKMYYEGFLRAGISVAGFDLGEVRGSPASTAQFTLFYDEMVKRGWSPKPILLGQSRGGLMMLAWAMRHPDKTQAFVGIYPVCNLESWPMKNKPVTLADYQLTEAELHAKMKELNPIDNLKGLLEKKVPMFVVHGDADAAVPYKENTLLLKERYESGGGAITVKLIPGEGHREIPAFFECQELLDFVLKQAASQGKLEHGYSRKDGHIYFAGQRIDQAGRHDIDRFAQSVGHPLKLCQDVDAASFVALSEEYSKDKNKVYFKWISPGRFWVVELPDADSDTFQVLDDNLAKDKQHVWKFDQVIDGADAASAEVVNPHWVWKDRNRVYYQGTSLAGADPATFRHLAQGFYRDAKRVYWGTDLLRDADPESFRACGEENPYAYDRQHVWSGNKVLEGVDAKTFKHLDGHVFKDAKRVYVGTSATVVLQADPASFMHVPNTSKVGLFKDRSRYYVYSPSYLELYSLERIGDSIFISKPVWLGNAHGKKESHGATVTAELKDGILSAVAVILEPAFQNEELPTHEIEKLKGMKTYFVEAEKLMGK